MIDIPQSVTSVNGMTGDVVIIGGGGIADPGSNGIIARTALNTTSARTITGTANQITVTNGDGVAGNPTLSLPNALTLPGSLYTNGGITVNAWWAASQIINYANVQYGSATVTPYSAISSLGDYAGVNFGSVIMDTGITQTSFVIDRVDYTGAYKASLMAINLNTNETAFSTTLKLAGNTYPSTDSTYTLGTSSLYWKETYTDRLYLNSTSYIDGATAGQLKVTGLFVPVQATTAGAPAYVKGAIYFDTTLNKLRVGGATAWETITSA